jgi:hypothetical protein
MDRLKADIARESAFLARVSNRKASGPACRIDAARIKYLLPVVRWQG